MATTKNKGIDIETKRKMLLTPCKTKQELINWTKYFLGLHLPDQKVSRYADSSPMDMVWEIYEIAVLDKNPENINELLYCAARDSGKCSKKGTLLLTPQGPKEIENIKAGEVVWTGTSWKTATEWFDEGIKPSVTIKTKEGIEICGSHKHRIKTLS